jgi:phosphonate transport system permease protein
VLLWSLAGAGLFTGEVLNPGGTAQFGRFASAALSPAVDAAFLGVLARSALVTVAYAAAGTALALVLGAAAAVLVSRTTWGRRRAGWLAARGLLAVPRGLHEAVWGLLLVNVLGLDPWVGVLAIGLPYGAVTAKVFADLVDEVPRGAYRALLAAGAGRPAAALYGLLPPAAGGLLSYAFYRLECAVRSAVVLGMVGAGGLGYQLALSFASLRWEQVWTAVYALAALCLAADVAGRAVRRRLAAPPSSARRDPVLTAAVVGTVVLVGWACWYLALSPASLVSSRTAGQLAYVFSAAWPPATDGDLLRTIGVLAVDTVQVSVIAVAVALLGAVLLAGPAARPAGRSGPGRRVAGCWCAAGCSCCGRCPRRCGRWCCSSCCCRGCCPARWRSASTRWGCWAGWPRRRPRSSTRGRGRRWPRWAPGRWVPGCTACCRGRPGRCWPMRCTAGRSPSATPCWSGCWAPVASVRCWPRSWRPSTGPR